MSRQQLKQYIQLKDLLRYCYTIPERDQRIANVGRVQALLADMVTE